MKRFKEKIGLLSKVMTNVADFNIKEFDEILADISSTEDPIIIPDLLNMMMDNFDYPEAMYSIIHVVEQFDDENYCKYVLKSLPDFILKSPYWASIILIRILNSENTLREFINICKEKATEIQKENLRQLVLEVGKDDSEFREKIMPLLQIL